MGVSTGLCAVCPRGNRASRSPAARRHAHAHSGDPRVLPPPGGGLLGCTVGYAALLWKADFFQLSVFVKQFTLSSGLWDFQFFSFLFFFLLSPLRSWQHLSCLTWWFSFGWVGSGAPLWFYFFFISFIINGAEHIFVCFEATCFPSLWNSWVRFVVVVLVLVARLSIGLFVF